MQHVYTIIHIYFPWNIQSSCEDDLSVSTSISENPIDDIGVVQLLSHVQFFVTPWTAAGQAPLSTTISWNLFKLMSIELVMLSNHFIFCHPLVLWLSIFPSIRVFSNESTLHIRWPKYWSFSFSISHSSEYLGLISFRMDCFDFLAVHRILKSLLQNHSFKVSIFQCSAFFMVQFSHLYMITVKTIALTRWTFVVYWWHTGQQNKALQLQVTKFMHWRRHISYNTFPPTHRKRYWFLLWRLHSTILTKLRSWGMYVYRFKIIYVLL